MVLAQFRTEGYGEVAEPKRYALFLELLFLIWGQFQTENRYALFLELLSAAGPSDLSTPAAFSFSVTRQCRDTICGQ
ncbi:hypothetical protein MPLSOD_40936 [Mesorhizobium sp. SOD10]|nr:hypothetical protein MPLSOD_40936 [Mesorhizobium sp. SOD10]